MNRLQNIFLLFSLFLTLSATAQSERPEVRATLTPDSVLLGDEVLLTIDVRKDQVQVIGFPTFDTGENGELELIEELPLDTIERDGRRQHLRKRYRLAAYGEGTLALGRTPLLYLDKNIEDTIYSADSLVLYIEPIEIDTTTMTINDVKRPKDMPLRWGEFEHREYLNLESFYTEKEATDILEKKFMKFLTTLSEKGVQIIEKDVTISKSGDMWIMDGTLTLSEPVTTLKKVENTMPIETVGN